jgi:hypothetical protein
LIRKRACSAFVTASLLLAGCNKFQHKKPDPTKGVVTGIVLCSDTGKPARFATVILSAAPKSGEKDDDADPLPASETTVADLDGRFRLEAVQPGRYYAFATLEGYLDPVLGIDPGRLSAKKTDRERHLDAIDQWKGHLVEVTVGVHRISEISLPIERAAEIDGTVTFDDGSPAIGMHFQLFRKTEKKEWTTVGLPLLDSFSIHAVSDGHGRYALTNLAAGEYAVCTLMPSDAEDSSSRVCLGNVFRRKTAKTVKVASAETVPGVDIEIPLAGLHTVSGTVSAFADGHAIAHGVVRLLYSDDREKARETALLDDGTYELDYVPEGKYILQISGAEDEDEKASAANQGVATKPVVTGVYADKETPINVLNDDEINVTVAPVAPAAAPTAMAPPAAAPPSQ